MTMVNQDEEHLRMLSILHYVWGGLIGFFSVFGLLYAIFGVTAMMFAARGHNGPPVLVGAMFLLFGLLFVLICGTISALTIWVGRNLSQRKRYTLCFVMACISCASFPLGTALGVFTLVVLLRPSVKQMFGRPIPISV
jgi:ABC-type transport system involved in multi-copper enzyme maturation permease subunit